MEFGSTNIKEDNTMADICENYLDVYGDEDEIDRAVREWTACEDPSGGDILFGEFEGWVRERSEGWASLVFLSKWTPHVWFVRGLSTRFPDLRLMYRWEEPAQELYGFAVLIGGAVQGVNHEPFCNPPPASARSDHRVITPE